MLACHQLRLGALIRLKRNRKLYRRAPPPEAGKRGAALKDGSLFQGSKPETWGEPDEAFQGSDEQGRPLTVQVWHRLHLQQAREGQVSVYRVLREGAKGTRRDPRESWFLWVRASPLPPEEVVGCYRQRFSQQRAPLSLPQTRSVLDESAGSHRRTVRAPEHRGRHRHEPTGGGS